MLLRDVLIGEIQACRYDKALDYLDESISKSDTESVEALSVLLDIWFVSCANGGVSEEAAKALYTELSDWLKVGSLDASFEAKISVANLIYRSAGLIVSHGFSKGEAFLYDCLKSNGETVAQLFADVNLIEKLAYVLMVLSATKQFNDSLPDSVWDELVHATYSEENSLNWLLLGCLFNQKMEDGADWNAAEMLLEDVKTNSRIEHIFALPINFNALLAACSKGDDQRNMVKTIMHLAKEIPEIHQFENELSCRKLLDLGTVLFQMQEYILSIKVLRFMFESANVRLSSYQVFQSLSYIGSAAENTNNLPLARDAYNQQLMMQVSTWNDNSTNGYAARANLARVMSLMGDNDTAYHVASGYDQGKSAANSEDFYLKQLVGLVDSLSLKLKETAAIS